MSRINTMNRGPATIALLLVPLACLGLGACGSSSSGSSSSTSTPATAAHTTAEATPTTSTSTEPATTAPASTTPTKTEPTITTKRQFDLVYECLRHNGVKLVPVKDLKSLSEVKINTRSEHYKRTLAKCDHEVLG